MVFLCSAKLICIICTTDELDADTIRSVSLTDVVEAYDAFVSPRNPNTRKKLSIQLVSHQMHEEPPTPEHITFIEDESRYRTSLGCYPAAVPVFREILHSHI